MCFYFSYFSFRNKTIFRTRKKNWKETRFFHELKNKFFCSLFTEREREGKWGILTLKKRNINFIAMDVNFAAKCQSLTCVWQREGCYWQGCDRCNIQSQLVSYLGEGIVRFTFVTNRCLLGSQTTNAFGHVALIVYAPYYFMHVYTCCCNIHPIASGR